MDIVKLFSEVAGLSVFIFTAVAQVKQFKVTGQWLTASAFIIGIVVGGAYRFFVYSPASPLDWFWLVMFGFAGGFIATNAYKGMESASGKNPPTAPDQSGQVMTSEDCEKRLGTLK